MLNVLLKKDKIKEFEEWLLGISKEVSLQEGNMGIDIIRPIDKSKLQYVVIFRFNNYENLTKIGKLFNTNNIKERQGISRSRSYVQKLSDRFGYPLYNDNLPRY